jgi:hypothetical protein
MPAPAQAVCLAHASLVVQTKAEQLVTMNYKCFIIWKMRVLMQLMTLQDHGS